MNTKIVYAVVLVVLLIMIAISCTKQLLEPKNNIVFNKLLSDYKIFKGDPNNLVPADGLPVFPDGTILVKTFYYYHDKGNPDLGKRIMETRLLILEAGSWSVATYIWNASQNDATYAEAGAAQPVEWTDDAGERKSINYQVPNLNECATCHNTNNKVVPIGFKMRNLNMTILENGRAINQLQSWMQSGWLQTFDMQGLTKVAAFNDNSQPLAQRVRAYLDINCAHCHNPSGFASSIEMNLEYTVPLEHTNIKGKKKSIPKRIENGSMPFLGTTVVDDKALSLIKEYLDSL